MPKGHLQTGDRMLLSAQWEKPKFPIDFDIQAVSHFARVAQIPPKDRPFACNVFVAKREDTDACLLAQEDYGSSGREIETRMRNAQRDCRPSLIELVTCQWVDIDHVKLVAVWVTVAGSHEEIV